MLWRLISIAVCIIFILVGCQSSEITSAKVYIQEKNWQKAYEQCKLATEKEPRNPDAWILLAQIYTELDSAPGIVKALDRVLYLDPNRIKEVQRVRSNAWQKFFNKGVLAGRKGAYEEAANWTYIAYTIDSMKAEGAIQLAFFYRKLGRNDDAIRFYRRTIELQPENDAAYLDLAATLINNRESDKAIEVLKKLIALKPDNKEAYRILGIAYTNQKQLDSASYAYSEHLKLEPSNIGVLLELGAILYETEKKDSALRVFEKVMELDPKNTQAKYSLGIVYDDLNKIDDARKMLEDVVRDEVDNYRAWSRLAVVIQKKGNIKLANAYYQFAEGLSAEEDGAKDEALKYYEKAVEYEPNFLQCWRKLSKLYDEMNISDKAAKAKDKVKELEKK